MLKLVPFNSDWITHDKLDLHAIYRRPSWTVDEFDETVQAFDDHGAPLMDVTTPLPVKQHNKWTAKGFEYVTLATRGDLVAAANKGTVRLLPGMTSWREYDQHQTGGPWNYKKYIAGQESIDKAAFDQLKADVERYGADAVEAIRRQTNPGFTLPESLRQKRRRAAATVGPTEGFPA